MSVNWSNYPKPEAARHPTSKAWKTDRSQEAILVLLPLSESRTVWSSLLRKSCIQEPPHLDKVKSSREHMAPLGELHIKLIVFTIIYSSNELAYLQSGFLNTYIYI